MTPRDEYVNQLKSQLDRWNAQMAKWEAQAKSAREDLRKRYAGDLETVRAEREKALYNLKLLEGASATAWQELKVGADQAWAKMREAIAQASKNFEKKG